ncbi:MAG: UDP-3-O-acyl-N-acetylglucosamine deacetylase [Elainellaceae cyanobacterium]
METTAPQADNLPQVAPPASHQSTAERNTLATPVELGGVGLHSGIESRVCIRPAPAFSGRAFVRTDQPQSPVIPATVDRVVSTQLSTELGVGEATVRTVEHVLAALAGMGIDDARIEIDGPEVPLLDGSARLWAEAIAAAGRMPQGRRDIRCLDQPVHLQDGEAWLTAFPADQCRFTYGIDFDLPAIGNQWHSWSPAVEPFKDAIAPARTFAIAHQIEQLRQHGLIRGGSLDNALVCSDKGWLNPPLRFSNEPARHKLLDLVGDMSLIGFLPRAHIVAYRASHRLHVQFAQQLAASVACRNVLQDSASRNSTLLDSALQNSAP